LRKNAVEYHEIQEGIHGGEEERKICLRVQRERHQKND
jgi:hypothetical protein